jgi:shikimate dehydrogenase
MGAATDRPMPLVVALIGHPVAHSRSPSMQQAALDAVGLRARYELWDTDLGDLERRIARLRSSGMLGANVTIPYKLAVAPLLDELAPSVTAVAGAVNTIVRAEAPHEIRLIGHNTDAAGFAAMLREAGVQLAGRRVVLLGAGGAARSVAGLAMAEGAGAVTIAARRVHAAAQLVADLCAGQGQLAEDAKAVALADSAALRAALRQADLLINATSVGTGDAAACPFDPTSVRYLPPAAVVCDLVYAPPETALLRAARAAGLVTINGLPMLLHQGAAAFELWTGRPAPLAIMRAGLAM